MNYRLVFLAACIAALLIAFQSSLTVSAEPHLQNPTRTPTDEPPKLPYVFPTPIHIQTFPNEPPRATNTPRPAGTVTGDQTYVVEAGDNPSTIAKKVYGDAGKFRLIVEANNLTDTTRLRVGTVLIISPLTPIAQPTAAAAQLASTPTLSSDATLAPTPATAIASPTPTASNSNPSSGNNFAVTLLDALSAIFFVAFLFTAALAYMFYQRAQRADKISLIKQRLKGK
jgi:hypothetical protein